MEVAATVVTSATVVTAATAVRRLGVDGGETGFEAGFGRLTIRLRVGVAGGALRPLASSAIE